MITPSERDKRTEFKNILYELAKDQNLLSKSSTRSKIYTRLEKLYYSQDPETTFRHFYSDVFSTLIKIKDDKTLGEIQVLGQNISIIRKRYKAINKDNNGNTIDINNALKKLEDHISLDIARLNYIDKLDRIATQEEKISDLQSTIQDLNSNTKEISTIVNQTEENVRSLQKDHVAILGIFAAVVLAFTGGIAFSTSVLSNIHLVSTYKTIAIVLIIGLVLVNTLFSLFYYIDKIVHNNQKPKILPSIIANVVLLILLALTLWAWNDGWIENRNERFIKQSEQQPAITYQIEQNISS